MAENSKIDLALKEIGFAKGLQVDIQDGRLVAICRQRLSRPKKNGVKTEIEIEEAITE